MNLYIYIYDISIGCLLTLSLEFIGPLRLFNLWGRCLAFFWSWLNWHSIMIVYTSPRSHCCDPLYWIIAMAIHESMMGHLAQVGTPGRIFALLGMGEEVWARTTLTSLCLLFCRRPNFGTSTILCHTLPPYNIIYTRGPCHPVKVSACITTITSCFKFSTYQICHINFPSVFLPIFWLPGRQVWMVEGRPEECPPPRSGRGNTHGLPVHPSWLPSVNSPSQADRLVESGHFKELDKILEQLSPGENVGLVFCWTKNVLICLTYFFGVWWYVSM